ncbi:uncharacterized protein DS421_13g422120 [Arachis hypogaea]|nr:uncharacterized protein DS421_13g422120 [Arachis hypogaea]
MMGHREMPPLLLSSSRLELLRSLLAVKPVTSAAVSLVLSGAVGGFMSAGSAARDREGKRSSDGKRSSVGAVRRH